MVSTSSNPKLGSEKPKCLIYARVSDEEQANKTFSSVDAQLAGGRRLAVDESLSIFEEIADEGASGKNLNRPGMKKLISILKTERISVLIASRLDRLSRDAVHTEYLIQLCSERGTKIQLLQQTLDEETASGRMGRRMNSVFSQYEREAIGDRVRYKIGELARKGMRAGGWTPPGFVRLKEHHYVEDEKYAPMVKRIFDEAASGRRIVDIAIGLKRAGFLVPKREINRRSGPVTVGGKPFTWNQVKHIISNPIYKGVLVAGKERAEFPSNLPRIVSDELWDRANSVASRKVRLKFSPNQNKHELLLNGLVFCGCCKGLLLAHPAISRQKKVYLYYRCQNLRKNGLSVRCSVRQVPARALEAAVIEQIAFLARDPVVLEAAMSEAVSEKKAQLTPLKSEISAFDESIDTLKVRFASLRDRRLTLQVGSAFIEEIEIEAKDLVRKRQDLEAKREILLEQKGVLEQQLGDGHQLKADLKRFADVFDVLPPAKKQQALRLIIRRIVVNRLPLGVTKSTGEFEENDPSIQKARYSVNLDLYVKPRFSNALGKEAGFFVFRSEMAARAGIEPATK